MIRTHTGSPVAPFFEAVRLDFLLVHPYNTRDPP